MKRVVVTGIGIVSPNGVCKNEVWENISNLHNGLTKSEIPGANFIGLVNKQYDSELNSKEKRYMDKSAQLAIVSSREAIADANISITQENCEDISVHIGSSIGGASTLVDEFGTAALEGANKMTMLGIPKALINMVSSNISIDLGIKGEALAYSNACASGTIAIGEAFRKIQHGEKKVILAGGTEACAMAEILNPFRKLRALSGGKTLNEASVPFSRYRSGFVLSEGAAMLILEEYEHAIEREADIYCEINGYGSSADAKSLLAPDLKGIKRCIENAINDAKINHNDVEYINAHGTSTKINDYTEAKALEEIFPNMPLVSSTKSLHGHSLGAAGAIEAAICSMMIKNNLLIPTINVNPNDVDVEIPSINFLLENTKSFKGGKVLSNSFAFGGHNATLVFGRTNK